MNFGLNISKRGIGFFWNKPGKRNYDAAKTTRTTSRWPGSSPNINSNVRYALRTLIARSRSAADNNPIMRNYLESCKANIVGSTGFQFHSRVVDEKGNPDEKTNRIIEEGYREFSKAENCTIEKRLSLRRLQKLLVEQMERDGAFLVKKHFGKKAGKFGFAFEILQADDIDHSYSTELPGGKIVVMGVQYNDKKQREGVWILERPILPGRVKQFDRKFYSLDKVIYEFDVTHPKLSVGIPAAAASLINMYKLNDFIDRANDRARIGTSLMAFIEPEKDAMIGLDGSGGADEGIGDTEESETLETEVDEINTWDLESNVMTRLDPGEKAKPFDPEWPQGIFEDFTKFVGRMIATGLSKIGFNKLMKNLESVNYSSLRSAELTEQDMWMMAQEDFIDMFFRNWFEDWLRMGIISDAIKLDYSEELIEKYNKPHFQPKRWGWVDPVKDISAAEKEIALNVTTKNAICNKKGTSFDEVIDQRKREAEKEYELLEILAEQNKLKAAAGITDKKTEVKISEDEDGKERTEIKLLA